jgi:hypothetical protein
MKHYIVYDPITGELEITGMCSDEGFEAQRREGKGLLEGVGSSATHYVSDGNLTEYTPEQATSKSARPSFKHQWSNETFSWLDPTTPGAQAWADSVRSERDTLLAESDWTDTLSAKTRLGDALYNAWQNYRQILRDVPQQAGFPTNVAWPEPPSPT